MGDILLVGRVGRAATGDGVVAAQRPNQLMRTGVSGANVICETSFPYRKYFLHSRGRGLRITCGACAPALPGESSLGGKP